VEAYQHQQCTGDIKYDFSIKKIVADIEEAQKRLNDLKDLTS
jgi:hypothetical protein